MKAWAIILIIVVAVAAIAGAALYLNNNGGDGPQPGPEPESTPLSNMYIVTSGGAPITNKEDYVDCQVTIDDDDNPLSNESGKIRGRGNTTWAYDKKPYNIKFDSKVDPFGMGASKKWCLLADYADVSLMRNYLVLNTADAIGCKFTPACHHVNLYLNGEYQGVYLLTEKVEIGKNRVNIDDSSTDDDIGFLAELDIYSAIGGDDPAFRIGTYTYVVKDPDVTPEQTKIVERKVAEAFEALDSGDWSRVTEVIDVDTFVSTYIIEELFKDADVYWSSFFIYHDLGGKIGSGPIWDFDKSTANLTAKHVAADTSDYKTLLAVKNPWYSALLKYDEFKDLLSKELLRCKSIILSELDACYEYAWSHHKDFKKNFTLWEYESLHGFLISFSG